MSKTRFHNLAVPLALIALSLLMQTAAMGQSVNVPTPAQIFGATQPGDKSVEMFDRLLGPFFANPLSTIGNSSTLVGALFLIFNSALFAIGVLWTGYGLLGSAAETAQSGQALGRRMSPVWMPIRIVIGIGGIMPVFGGFSLAQVLIVTMTSLGIGLANLMWSGAITATSQFTGVAPTSLVAANSGAIDFKAAARSAFEMNVCQLATRDVEAMKASSGVPTMNPISSWGTNQPRAVMTQWGTQYDPSLCGFVMVSQNEAVGRSATSTNGFRSRAINYDAYANRVVDSYLQGFPAFNQNVEQIARAWLNARANARGQPVLFPQAQLDAAATNYANAVTAALAANAAQANNEAGALATDALNKMKALGWAGAGSWFSTFAEANAALAEAMKAASWSYGLPNTGSMGESHVREAMAGIVKSEASIATGGVNGNATGNASFNAVEKFLCSAMNCINAPTFGQAVVGAAIQAAGTSSGGTTLVNPIIMFKNMGDNLMVATQIIGGVVWAVDRSGIVDIIGSGTGSGTGSGGAVAASEGSSKPGLLAKGAGLVAKYVGGPLLNLAMAAVSEVFALLKFLLPYMLVLGLLMSVYIPLIPFITWMGGLIQYAVVVCMGLVGAPIAALSHLETEGEGLGRRTEAGYMFILNVTFRPALMLFGFFLASGLLIVIGTFQAEMFMGAMEGAQGNSWTGFFSIIGFLTIFFVLNVTLIQGLFNMIFLIPDQVLGLIGNGGNMEAIGRETESKINGFFMGYGRRLESLSGAGAKTRSAVREGVDTVKGIPGVGVPKTPTSSSPRS